MWSFIDNEDVGLEAAIIERKRNSSPIERLCATDDRDSSISPKFRDCKLHKEEEEFVRFIYVTCKSKDRV